jgi:hypothetical protein
MTAALPGDPGSFPIGEFSFPIGGIPLARTRSVIAGLVPAISIRMAQCPIYRDGRDIRAFTPVFDGLLPGHDQAGLPRVSSPLLFPLAKLSNILDNLKTESTANAYSPC